MLRRIVLTLGAAVALATAALLAVSAPNAATGAAYVMANCWAAWLAGCALAFAYLAFNRSL